MAIVFANSLNMNLMKDGTNMLSSIDWNAYEAYRRQIETFRAKDLTDHEVLVMKWMQSEVKRFEEMKKRESE